MPAKSSHVVRTLQSKWPENLELHGDEYGFDEALGPTIELARHFSTWGFFNRERFSTRGLDGMGDSWGELQVPYMLAKFVFVALQYPGWTR